MGKNGYRLYIAAMTAALLVPFAGMTFWKTDRTTENKEMSEWPSVMEDGKFNLNILEEMGTYFEDHFAFRLQMLTANAKLWTETTKTSTTDQVVAGKDDWLYYSGTVGDYTGEELLSSREMYAVVHNLSMMRDYIEAKGSRFILTIAPNKNTLYGEYMPYYYREGSQSNLDRLVPLLEEAGIEYADLKSAFEAKEEVLYFRRDSHWNNKGACLAYNTIMDTAGRQHETYLNLPYETKKDHIGDIDEILYPLAAEEEEDVYYDKEWGYKYVNEVQDNMDPWIETMAPGKEGSLLMYRDSFGESLLPFFAEEYARACFSRLVPYNMENLDYCRPDTVVVERVERKIAAFATEIPIMESPLTENIRPSAKTTDTVIKTEQDGAYLVIRGTVDETCIDEDTEILVAVSGQDRTELKTYEAFYTLSTKGDGNGYQIYIKREHLPSDSIHIDVITRDGEESWITASADKEITWKEQ